MPPAPTPTSASRPLTADVFAELFAAVAPTEPVHDWFAVDQHLPDIARAHPGWPHLVSVVARDPAFAPFTDASGVMFSNGHGVQGVDAEGLAAELVLMAWRRLDFSGEQRRRWRLAAVARSVVDDVGRMAAGEEVHVPAYLLWDGPRLDADRRLHGAFGTLRWVPELTRPYVQAQMYGGLTLFTKVPVVAGALDSSSRDPDFYGAGNVTQRALDRVANQVALALLDDVADIDADSAYAASSGPPARLVLVGISAPWSSGHHFAEAIDDVGTQADIINPRAVEQRLDFYVRNWRREADLAARRLVASAQDGRSDDDALVDAVTAWESLLGSRSETTFKVTAAMARLLSNTVGSRERLVRELKGIYDLRSRAVHGSADLTLRDVDALDASRRRATAVGAELLRVLLGARSDLLDRKTERRAERVLLE